MSDIRRGPNESLSGLTEAEAREFQRIFMISFWVFMLICFIAHILALLWRPWLQGPAPTASLLGHAHYALNCVIPHLV
jgi:light-harvesting complex 1 beta chain